MEIGRNDVALNTDIAIEQAKLEQTNVHFILEKGTAMVVDAINVKLNAVIKANEVKDRKHSSRRCHNILLHLKEPSD